MKRIILIFCVIYSTHIYSFQYAIKCDEPRGLRIDYFVSNTAELQNKKFISESDKISGASPMIFFYKDKALVILEGTVLFGGEAHINILAYLLSDEDQISMVGILNRAPYMFTYFPKLNILYFSSQRSLVLPGYGANEQIFASSCSPPISREDFNNYVPNMEPEFKKILNKLGSVDNLSLRH